MAENAKPTVLDTQAAKKIAAEVRTKCWPGSEIATNGGGKEVTLQAAITSKIAATADKPVDVPCTTEESVEDIRSRVCRSRVRQARTNHGGAIRTPH